MRTRLIALALALAAAVPAQATHVGLFLDAGPGYYQLAPADDFGSRSFTPVVFHLGVFADGFADMGRESIFEMDLGLLAGGVLNLVAPTDQTGTGQSLTLPTAVDDPSVRLEIGHLFRFRTASASLGQLPLGFAYGANFDVDIGILEVAGAGIQYGAPYVGIALGPTLAYLPTHNLRMFVSPNVGLHIGDARDIFTGWSLGGQGDVLYAIIPRYLDLKGHVFVESRTWFPDNDPTGGGTIAGFGATVGVIGQLGWLFGIDGEDITAAEREAYKQKQSEPSGGDTGQRG
jgi:hypothetical protein